MTRSAASLRPGLEPDPKAYGSNHRQQRTAFETHNGRSALSAATGLHAPHLPFAIAMGIG